MRLFTAARIRLGALITLLRIVGAPRTVVAAGVMGIARTTGAAVSPSLAGPLLASAALMEVEAMLPSATVCPQAVPKHERASLTGTSPWSTLSAKAGIYAGLHCAESLSRPNAPALPT